MNATLLSAIAAEGARAPKENLIKQLDFHTRELVRMALDPDVTFGVTVGDDEWCAAVWATPKRQMDDGPWTELFHIALEKCRKRELSGNSAVTAVNQIVIAAPTSEHAKWAGRIINRQLRAGFDIKTFNKVFGKKIVKFEVQLADTYDPAKHQLRGLWFFQPKLDGNRVLILDGVPYSRNGKVYSAAQQIVDEFLELDPDFFKKWVVDSEMMGNLGFDQSSGALRRIDDKGRKKAEFTCWVFDLIDRQEWEKRETRSLLYRRSDLNSVLGKANLKNIKLVPWMQLHDPTHQQIMQICDDYRAAGFEGAMAKDAQAAYAWGRKANLLKVKRFFDADLRIVGFYEGKGKHKGRLGGIVVEGEFEGRKIRSECGSGFDDPTRELVWGDQRGWMSAIVQVQFQEVTPDGSLRFPVFCMRRKDKE